MGAKSSQSFFLKLLRRMPQNARMCYATKCENSPFVILDQNLDPVTLSIGLATFPQHGSTGEQLLRIADQCLYQSKAAGRDRVTTPHASEDVTKREASVIG